MKRNTATVFYQIPQGKAFSNGLIEIDNTFISCIVMSDMVLIVHLDTPPLLASMETVLGPLLYSLKCRY